MATQRPGEASVDESGGVAASEETEYRVAGLPRAGRVIVEEQAHDISRCEDAADGLEGRVQHPCVRIDRHAAEGEGDPRGDRIGAERPPDQRLCPIRLSRRESYRAFPIQLA